MRFSPLKPLRERYRSLDLSLESFLDRHPSVARNVARYGWMLLLVVAALVATGGAVTAGGRSQEVVYATEDGSIVSMEPVSGAVTTIFEGEESYAMGPARAGGSRGISFTALRDSDGELRGDLYSVDLARGTRALSVRAGAGEVFAFPDFSTDRAWILATRYAEGSPPNVLVLPAGGAAERLLEPDLPGRPPILGPVWISKEAIYAWRTARPGELALTAYNIHERRQATVYETAGQVGLPSYYREANALIFAERPRGAGLAASRLRLLVGTSELPVSGIGELGLYDPSPPVASLDDRIAVMWTDGEETGVGLLDPEGRSFGETGILVEEGSRHPRISRDGRYLSTTDAGGSELTVRRMRDGAVVRRVRDLQPPGAATEGMREAGLVVPPEAEWFAPASYSWRSLDDA
jgi:hypothetical protein